LLGVKATGAWMLNTHRQLLPKVRMSGTIPSLSYTPSWRVEMHFSVY